MLNLRFARGGRSKEAVRETLGRDGIAFADVVMLICDKNEGKGPVEGPVGGQFRRRISPVLNSPLDLYTEKKRFESEGKEVNFKLSFSSTSRGSFLLFTLPIVRVSV